MPKTLIFLCPRHSKNGGGALSVTPVRAFVRPCVRPSIIKIWCPLNNFWKTASIQFKFGMLIYNIKTQVKFDLSYNPLIFDRVMGLSQKQSTKIGVRSITFERLHWFYSYLACWYKISKHRSSWIWVTIHYFLTELWAFYKNIAHLAGASVSYGHISSSKYFNCFEVQCTVLMNILFNLYIIERRGLAFCCMHHVQAKLMYQ